MHTANVSPVSISGRNRFMHMDDVAPFEGELVVASWNVEGLTDIKLWELTAMMKRRGISVVCIQETHIIQSPYYTTVDNFLVILSGSSGGLREFAGVGFIIAPWAVHSVVGFLQYSNRLACLKFRVPGGKVGVISAYAPHDGHSFDSRQSFFEDLGSVYERTSVNLSKLIFGDLNASLRQALPGEEAYIGEFVFEHLQGVAALGSNRELLLELCATYGLAVSNTFMNVPVGDRATYRFPGTPPLQEVTSEKFRQLDFLLLPQLQLDSLLDLRSVRAEALASHHFLLVAKLAIVGGGRVTRNGPRPQTIDRSLLNCFEVAVSFRETFTRSLSPKVDEIAHCDINTHCCLVEDAFDEAAKVLQVPATAP